MAETRQRGRRLLEQASDKYSIGRFRAADAVFVFWIQGRREPTAGELADVVAWVVDKMDEFGIGGHGA